jgi:hypothetical protein
LRFDKVATRLIESLRATLSEAVADGTTVLLTVTAPIRLPSRTAALLEDKVRGLLARGSVVRSATPVLHGNRVTIQSMRCEEGQAPRVIVFVHNDDSDPPILARMTKELLEVNSAAAARRALRGGGRWLVLTSARGASSLQAYGYIWSQLRAVSGVERVLMVFGDGRVRAV